MTRRVAASMSSPVSATSRARESGSRVPSRVPPPPAIRPRLTSGSPNRAVSAATTRSQANASSKPPPTAAPFTAAITGLAGNVRKFERGRDVRVRIRRAPAAPAARTLLALAEGAQVHAGTEDPLTGAREHEHLGGVVGVALVKGPAQLSQHFGIERIGRFGPVRA